MKKILLLATIIFSVLQIATATAKLPDNSPVTHDRQAGERRNDYTDQTKPISVTKQHPHFSIKLKANPSTGYNWILKSVSDNYIEPEFQKYVAANTRMVGAPGISEFGFVVKADAFKVSRQFTITFVYVRPWELPTSEDTTLQFTVITQAEL